MVPLLSINLLNEIKWKELTSGWPRNIKNSPAAVIHCYHVLHIKISKWFQISKLLCLEWVWAHFSVNIQIVILKKHARAITFIGIATVCIKMFTQNKSFDLFQYLNVHN